MKVAMLSLSVVVGRSWLMIGSSVGWA
jgi:hypothetical protein